MSSIVLFVWEKRDLIFSFTGLFSGFQKEIQIKKKKKHFSKI